MFAFATVAACLIYAHLDVLMIVVFSCFCGMFDVDVGVLFFLCCGSGEGNDDDIRFATPLDSICSWDVCTSIIYCSILCSGGVGDEHICNP